jgi:hypothetical protein
MKPVRAIYERRMHPRHRVRVAVLWSGRRSQPEPGEICDISARGLFLVATGALPDVVGVGDSVRVSVRTDRGEGTLAGMVCWRGYHSQYETIGCGIRFDEESIATADRLFPILRQPAKP